MLKVVDPGKKLFRKAVHYHTYRLIEQSERYDEVVAHEVHRTAKTTAVQMTDRKRYATHTNVANLEN